MISEAERKENFRKWMSEEKRQRNGNNYAKSTVVAYISALTTVPSQLAGIQLEKNDVFEISSVEELQSQWNIMNKASNFDELKRNGRMMISSRHSGFIQNF